MNAIEFKHLPICAISEHMPNLDDMATTPEEMEQIKFELMGLARGIFELTEYANVKQRSMQARLDGKILLAKRHEKLVAEPLYKQLPDWAKW